MPLPLASSSLSLGLPLELGLLLPLFFEALEAANNPDFADFMELLVRAGLRRNEAASLLWTDVDFESETFTIRAEVSKNGKALTLPTSKQILALLDRRREATPERGK